VYVARELNTSFMGFPLSKLKTTLRQIKQCNVIPALCQSYRVATWSSPDVRDPGWCRRQIILEGSQGHSKFCPMTLQPIPFVLSVLIVERLSLAQSVSPIPRLTDSSLNIGSISSSARTKQLIERRVKPRAVQAGGDALLLQFKQREAVYL